MDTTQKYNEAEYFLGLMKENVEDRQKFKYNFSAFVSAARSITFLLQKEVSKNQGFDEWYCKKQMQMEQDELFKFFKKKRNYILKEGLINPRAEISMTIPYSAAGSYSVEAIVRNAGGIITDYEYSESPAKPKPVSKPKVVEETAYKWFFADWPEPNEDVITLCEKYLDELKLIVEEAENKFCEANSQQKQLTTK